MSSFTDELNAVFNTTDLEIIASLRDARDARDKAEAKRCTCSDFVIQVQGCSCDVGLERAKAQLTLDKLIGEL